MQVANPGAFHYSLQTECSGELSPGSVTAEVRGGNGDGGTPRVSPMIHQLLAAPWSRPLLLPQPSLPQV